MENQVQKKQTKELKIKNTARSLSNSLINNQYSASVNTKIRNFLIKRRKLFIGLLILFWLGALIYLGLTGCIKEWMFGNCAYPTLWQRISMNFSKTETLRPIPLPTDSLTPILNSVTNWKTYINDEYEFEFKYPADWQVILLTDTSFTVSNIGFDPKLDGATPLPGQVFLKFSLTHASLENYTTAKRIYISTEGVEVIKQGRYIDPSESIGIISLYRIDDPKASEHEKIIDQILSTFQLLPGMTDWKTYGNEKYGFELKYPQDWTVDEVTPSAIYFIGPFEGPDPIVGVIFIYTNLEDAINDMGHQFEQRVVTQKEISINGRKALRVTVTTPEIADWSMSSVLIESEEYSFRLNMSGKPRPQFAGIEQKILSSFKFTE